MQTTSDGGQTRDSDEDGNSGGGNSVGDGDGSSLVENIPGFDATTALAALVAVLVLVTRRH
jgi:PGF-CTERM protein